MEPLTLAPPAVLFAALGWCTLASIRRWDVAAMVNTLAASGSAVLSLVVVVEIHSPLTGGLVAPALPLWVALAGVVHSVGMLGWYDTVWWWDHLTHTVSSMLVTALLYAGIVVAVDTGSIPLLSPAAVGIVTVAFVFLVGVFWELIELLARAVGERYEIEPVLVHYGWRDTAFDLLFNLFGATAIVALDVRVFVDLAARFPVFTGALLSWFGGLVAVGSMLLVLVLGVSEQHEAWGV